MSLSVADWLAAKFASAITSYLAPQFSELKNLMSELHDLVAALQVDLGAVSTKVSDVLAKLAANPAVDPTDVAALQAIDQGLKDMAAQIDAANPPATPDQPTPPAS